MLYEHEHQKVTLRLTDSGKVLLFPSAQIPASDESAPLYLTLNADQAPTALTLVSHVCSPDSLTLTYTACEGSLTFVAQIDRVGEGNVYRQTNTVSNTSDRPIAISSLSSVILDNLGKCGEKTWYEDGKLALHYCSNYWEKEGQWHTLTMDEADLVPATLHSWEHCDTVFRSFGSMSSTRYFPLFLLEDRESGSIWFVENEGGLAWTAKIGFVGGLYGSNLHLSMSAADDLTSDWHLDLKPGESYTTSPAVFGCAVGGFDEAVRNLVSYRRAVSLVSFENREIPLVFNDYMDCLWCVRNHDVMHKLVDAAADAGCEYFCIDAGWHKNGEKGDNWASALGDWIVDDAPFGEGGLQGTLDYIREKGMKPGVWFEIESVNANSRLCQIPGALLTRRSHTVSPSRAFVNFTCPEAAAYLRSRVEALYGMGVRYIKNDYNNNVCGGADLGDSLADGLRRNADAFLAFWDGIRASHPDLIVENCASGAAREDTGTLRHFDLQSFSDQELYDRNPSLICGSLAYIQPEKLGIWAYPYPVMCDDREKPLTPDLFAGMEDGEETVFNLVNALCGSFYLSGHIEQADDFNRALIREAADLFKAIRPRIKSAVPVFPLGQLRVTKSGFLALGLQDETGMNLAVWRFRTDAPSVTLDLGKYVGDAMTVKQIFPAHDKKVALTVDGAKMTLTFPQTKPNMARYFRVESR